MEIGKGQGSYGKDLSLWEVGNNQWDLDDMEDDSEEDPRKEMEAVGKCKPVNPEERVKLSVIKETATENRNQNIQIEYEIDAETGLPLIKIPETNTAIAIQKEDNSLPVDMLELFTENRIVSKAALTGQIMAESGDRIVSKAAMAEQTVTEAISKKDIIREHERERKRIYRLKKRRQESQMSLNTPSTSAGFNN